MPKSESDKQQFLKKFWISEKIGGWHSVGMRANQGETDGLHNGMETVWAFSKNNTDFSIMTWSVSLYRTIC